MPTLLGHLALRRLTDQTKDPATEAYLLGQIHLDRQHPGRELGSRLSPWVASHRATSLR